MTAAATLRLSAPENRSPAFAVFDRVVAIYQLAREFELWLWLCPRHIAARKGKGWAIRVRKLAPPRVLTYVGVEQAWGGSAAACLAALDDRTALPCTDCENAKRH